MAKTDGLLEYRKEIPYLYSKYLSLINKHDPLLNDIRRIRNKYTHIIHGVKVLSHYSSMLINGFEFKIKSRDSVRISVGSLIILFTDLNEIFSQLVYDAFAWADTQGKSSYAYYERMGRVDFNDFNEIYNSPLLNKISKIMYDF